MKKSSTVVSMAWPRSGREILYDLFALIYFKCRNSVINNIVTSCHLAVVLKISLLCANQCKSPVPLFYFP